MLGHSNHNFISNHPWSYLNKTKDFLLIQLPLYMLLKGQIFSFGCEDFDGQYGLALSELIYKIIKSIEFDGSFQFYIGNLPYWSSNYAIGIVPLIGKKWGFWEAFEVKLKNNLEDQVHYYGIEATSISRLKAVKLLYAGNFEFKEGTVNAIIEPSIIETSEFLSLIIDDDTIEDKVKAAK